MKDNVTIRGFESYSSKERRMRIVCKCPYCDAYVGVTEQIKGKETVEVKCVERTFTVVSPYHLIDVRGPDPHRPVESPRDVIVNLSKPIQGLENKGIKHEI